MNYAQIKYNTATTQMISVSQNANIIAMFSTFSSNYGGPKGGVFYLAQSLPQSSFYNCTFTFNHAFFGGNLILIPNKKSHLIF